MAIALAYFTGITLIVGWSLPEGAAMYRRAERTMHLADTGFSGATTAPAKLMPATGRTAEQGELRGMRCHRIGAYDRHA